MHFGWNKKDFTLEKRNVRKELPGYWSQQILLFSILVLGKLSNDFIIEAGFG